MRSANFLQVLDAVGIVDREHRHAMLHLPQPGDGLFADALRGAVGRDQLGVAGLQLLQPLDEPIVLRIADFRRRL